MHSLLLLLLALPAADAPAPLRAGAAAVDVSPKQFPVNLPGNFAENLAEKNGDALHVRAIVLDDGKTTIALVLVDNLGVVREVCDEVKLLASRKLSMLPENILISSTHTHSAPPANVKAGRPGEVAYRKQLIDGMVEAIVKAGAARRPARVGAATHPLPDEVFNRRWFLKPGKMTPNPFGGIDLVRMNPPHTMDVLSHPAGPTDPDVSVLSFNEAKTNKPLALYANYALHYVGGIPPKIASSDYFGEFARLMPNRVGGDDRFVAMISNGASGDINNIPFGVGRPPREPFEQIRLVAARTADAAYHARAKITHQGDVTLGMVQRPLTLRMRRPDAKQVAWAKEVLAEKDEKKVLPLAPAYARRYMRLADSEEKVEVLLQAVRIGDVAICAIPFETFVQIGLDIKKRSPFGKTIVVGLANGYTGYLPTPEQHRLGGYETWLGTNWVQEDASVLITNQMLEMLDKLAREKQP